jgi:ABC-type Fe3+ transport system substrate-binding protein
MRPSSIVSAVLALAFILIGSASAATNDEIFNYKGADRQTFLETGAKKEGSVLLYAVATQLEPIMKRFQEKYPFVRLTLGRADATDIAKRVVEEAKVGVFNADGFEVTGGGLLAIRSEALLAPFYTPAMEVMDPRAVQQERLWASARESYSGIGYNSKSVSAADAPKTWQDLLNPKYKGMMGVTNSASSAGSWTGILFLACGEDFVRKLGQEQQVKVFNTSSRGVADLTVSGEVPIAARAVNAHIIDSAKKGASVVWVDPGPVAVSDNSVAVLKKAPHPYAMMLMVDFLLSKEGQTMYGELGYDSARNDIATGSHPKEKVYLEHRPDFLNEFDNWLALFNKYFKTKG